MIRLDHQQGSAVVDPIGARVVAWAPTGAQAVLWAPPERLAEPGQWAHGGIPICFPWFARPPEAGRPFHGLVHSVPWRQSEQQARDGCLVSTWQPEPPPADLDGWQLQLTLQVGSRLQLRLVATNTAHHPLTASPCFHCYLATADRDACRIAGLEDAAGIDKQKQGEAITFPDEPWAPPERMDRIAHQGGRVSLHDPILGRTIVLAAPGCTETVCWAPGEAACKAVPELSSGHARSTCCCIEPAAGLRQALCIPPGDRLVLDLDVSLG